MSGYIPEKHREYMRNYMRRYRARGAIQPARWTEERLTETWEQRKARRAAERERADG